MKITLNRLDDDFLFECKNEEGHSILLDNVHRPCSKGASPMQAVMMAVAGCNGIDIVSILKKQKQEITDFKSEVDAERITTEEGAKPFQNIMVTVRLEGNIEPAKAKRAAELSFTKYCSVSKSLDPNIELKYQVILNGKVVE